MGIFYISVTIHPWILVCLKTMAQASSATVFSQRDLRVCMLLTMPVTLHPSDQT